jgi:hypothetical protein
MNKTLQDKFIELTHEIGSLSDVVYALTGYIEYRLFTLEHPAPPVQSAVDWLHEIESRLSALEHPEPDKQLSAKPAETEREWIKFTDPPNVTVWYWDTYKGRNKVRKLMASELSEGDMWMPYRKGDVKPEPPKGDK